MSVKFEVDDNRLGDDAEKLYEIISEFEQVINKTYEKMTELDGMWDGPAKDTYISQFKADYNTLRDIVSSLKNYSDSLENAKNVYEKCETGVVALVNGINIG
ncbi:MAG: WXG100 family type VII secretion target [Porcipelethomonas sp.]